MKQIHMTNNSIHFSVAGRIISELSEKIPDTIVALNELIKNSYDAFAKEVEITLDSEAKTLLICDNGYGMSLEQIGRLFHIAKSEKTYGEVISGEIDGHDCKRICQGSKGLGFLAAFKFGSKVKWETSSVVDNCVYTFSLDRDEINNLEDLNDYNVEVPSSDFEKQGTIIEISLDEYSLNALKDCFSNEVDYKKIIESIKDDSFKITIVFDGKILSSNALKTFMGESEEIQICRVEYNSAYPKLIFKKGGVTITEKDYSIGSESFSVDLDIVVYSFKGKKKKTSGISNLFYRPKSEDLTPLLFINNVFFNNFNLYDPEINRKRGNSISFPQQVGYINVCSANPSLEFNSDRTNLVKNSLTDNIADTLRDINLLIQQTIAEKKLNRLNFAKRGKEEDAPPKSSASSQGTKDKDATQPQETVKGPSASTAIRPAQIKLTSNTNTIKTGSEQINLLKYVVEVIDSHGNKVNPEELSIYCNDEILPSKILESQTEPCVKIIRFEYLDRLTKLTCQTLTISFVNETTELPPGSDPLITPHTEYDEFKKHSSELLLLIDEINKLNPNPKKLKYPRVTACALRTVLELAVDTIISTGALELRVKKILSVDLKDRTNSSAISKNSIQYKNFKNVVTSFNDKILESLMSTLNISTHKSTYYVTEQELVDAAKHVSNILYIISVFLKCNIKP